MTRARIFVPGSLGQLAELAGARSATVVTSGAAAHGVTEALRTDYPDADDEELEYLAMTAAAQQSVAFVDIDGPQRRVVLAVDADSPVPAESDDPSAVRVSHEVPLADLVAVHVDSEDAAADVAAASAAAAEGADDADDRLQRCLDHELGWYAASELGELVRGLRGR